MMVRTLGSMSAGCSSMNFPTAAYRSRRVRRHRAPDCLVCLAQLGFLCTHLQADTAAARRGLEHHRVADPVGLGYSLVNAVQQAAAREHRDSGLARK
jgi:hypothetical protein